MAATMFRAGAPWRRALLGLGALAGAGATVGAAALAWGAWERVNPIVEWRRIQTGRAAPLRVLHVSDLHLRAADDWLVDFTRALAGLDPDLVVSTGDNFGDLGELPALERAYDPLLAFPGVFVFGSNDFFSPKPKPWFYYLMPHRKQHQTTRLADLPTRKLADFFEGAGWVDLNNRDALMRFSGGLEVALVGTGDAHIGLDQLEHVGSWPQGRGTLRFGVTHAPYSRVLEAMLDAGADVVFAGHTHGGQLCIPGRGALVSNCDLDPQYASGLFTWDGCPHELTEPPALTGESGWMLVNVSAGLGTNKFAPFRVACRSRVTVIDFV